ncbi:hypothetical protein DPSP01_000416 [Paraphaeosphaeria sporulosa]
MAPGSVKLAYAGPPDRPTWLLCSVAVLSCRPRPVEAPSQFAAARRKARGQCCLRAHKKRAVLVSRRGLVTVAPRQHIAAKICWARPEPNSPPILRQSKQRPSG